MTIRSNYLKKAARPSQSPAVTALPEGEPRVCTRLPMPRTSYVRGDVGIAPYENAESVCVIFTGGQSRPPLHPSTVPAPCPCPVIPSQ